MFLLFYAPQFTVLLQAAPIPPKSRLHAGYKNQVGVLKSGLIILFHGDPFCRSVGTIWLHGFLKSVHECISNKQASPKMSFWRPEGLKNSLPVQHLVTVCNRGVMI
jgi:hypothetical protein